MSQVYLYVLKMPVTELKRSLHYLAAKNAWLSFAKEEKAAYSDVIRIGVGGRRLKHTTEELWICSKVIFLIVLIRIIIGWGALLDYLLRHLNLTEQPRAISKLIVHQEMVWPLEDPNELLLWKSFGRLAKSNSHRNALRFPFYTSSRQFNRRQFDLFKHLHSLIRSGFVIQSPDTPK